LASLGKNKGYSKRCRLLSSLTVALILLSVFFLYIFLNIFAASRMMFGPSDATNTQVVFSFPLLSFLTSNNRGSNVDPSRDQPSVTPVDRGPVTRESPLTGKGPKTGAEWAPRNPCPGRTSGRPVGIN
jgi:hypothetical protein